MSILRKNKEHSFKGEEEEKRGRGKFSLSPLHRYVQTKTCRSGPSSLRLSRGKAAALASSEWTDSTQLQLRKKTQTHSSVVAVICSDDRGGKSQRIRMRSSSQTGRKFIFPSRQWRPDAGEQGRSRAAEWTTCLFEEMVWRFCLKLRTFLPERYCWTSSVWTDLTLVWGSISCSRICQACVEPSLCCCGQI